MLIRQVIQIVDNLSFFVVCTVSEVECVITAYLIKKCGNVEGEKIEQNYLRINKVVNIPKL